MTQNVSDPKDNVEHYKHMLEDLKASLFPKLPKIEQNQQSLFCKTCRLVVLAQQARDAAEKSRDNLPDDKREDANKALEKAQAALVEAVEVNIDAARPILDSIDLKGFDMTKLMNFCILAQGTPEELGKFANLGDEEAAMIDNLLNDSNLQRQILIAGGPKKSKYGPALKTYKSITSTSALWKDHDVLQRFALGTSLEHAVPIAEFDTPSIFVDPLERYLHYEASYLGGELDPTFAHRTAWECRMIGDCNATNEQHGWGRSMLRNYRPDEVLLKDYKWRYCVAVRTEVGYKKPDWQSSPHTYQQLISGGGQCGPRAWFGRFCCKIYGIPTWGARQPGHAMCHHWTPNGWVGILGADWKYSWWEERCGPDFLLETQAREAQGEDVYFDRVMCLQMIGDLVGEKHLSTRTGPLPDANQVWNSLALMEKKILAASKRKHVTSGTSSEIPNLISKLLPEIDAQEPIQYKEEQIIIPAANCSTPTKSTANIIFMKSFLGGRQLHHLKADTFEYTLTDVQRAGTYNVVLRVTTVHLKERPPFLLTVTPSGDDESINVAQIEVPYTVGEWEYTEPVPIALSGGTNTLQFGRETPNHGVSIKDITLTFVP